MLHFDLSAGWLTCTFTAVEPPARITASYLADAPGDLAAAVVALLRGEADASAAWAEEPGEHRWRLRRVGPDRVQVQVLAFPDTFRHRPDAEGEVLVDATVRLRTFAGALVSELQRLQRVLGAEGYAREWHTYPFPAERLAQLQALLKAGRLPPGAAV